MSYTDLLTIAMPCYERKEFFKDALDSALNQTVKCKIIVIDNCSSHNYFEEVCRDKGVDYFRNEKNIGIVGNFSRSFELSKTKFTMNLQDDDLLEPTYVEFFLKALEKHPDIDIYFTDFSLLTPQKDKQHKHILPFGYMEKGNKIIEYGIKYRLGFPYMSSVIRTEIAHSFSEIKDFQGSFDWEWIYGNADRFAFFGDKRKLYIYRQHGNQDTTQNCSNYILSIPYIYEMVLGKKVSDKNLLRRISMNTFLMLLFLKSNTEKTKLNNFKNGKSKYEVYLKNKMHKNKFLRIFFLVHPKLISFLMKFIDKIGVKYRP